jgi:hypothetical protein
MPKEAAAKKAPSSLAAQQQRILKERRAHARYSPDPLIPVFFCHREAATPCCGHIMDLSMDGLRIVAPPTVRPLLHWEETVWIQLTYSESNRTEGIEGLTLKAQVVRAVSDRTSYVLQARMIGDKRKRQHLAEYIEKLAEAERNR